MILACQAMSTEVFAVIFGGALLVGVVIGETFK